MLKRWQIPLLGFVFLLLAIGLGVMAWFGALIGLQMDRFSILAIGLGMFFLIVAAYAVLRVQDWALLPAVAGGIYAVLPEVYHGLEDDVLAIMLGAFLSGALAVWKQHRIRKREAQELLDAEELLKQQTELKLEVSEEKEK